MTNVVLVVDMIRGFLEQGHILYCGDEARQIIPTIKTLLKEQKEQGSTIIFVCDNHEIDDAEFEIFPVHCVNGTDETEIIDELRGYSDEIIYKRRYSAFFDTCLESCLVQTAPGKLIICGVCTDICVLHTVADARNRDYPVEVRSAAVASFDIDAHESALVHMRKILGANVI